MTTPLLHIEHLTVDYGRLRALSDVSLTVDRGQSLAILGPNGAGKSTLARAVSGLIPFTGSVRLDGVDCRGTTAHRMRRRGVVYLPEGRGIFPDLSVKDNLRLAGIDTSGSDALDRVTSLFPVLKDRLTQVSGSLSGGEQQMLSLARAVGSDPALVIADELSLGLAPKVVDLVFESLAQIREQGAAIIIIEQFVHRALEFADRCHLLSRGATVWQGASDDAQDRVLEAYLGTAAV